MVQFLVTQLVWAASISFDYLGAFGRGPSQAPGEFNYPSGVGVDSSTGDVYVMDAYFHRIQKFDANGNYITQWKSSGGLGVSVDPRSHAVYVASPNNSKIRKYDQNGQLLVEWGSYGTQEEQFNKPRDVAVNPTNGNVLVIDSGNKRVQEFDSNGNFIKTWGGNFYRPYGISIDTGGQFVYVANTGGCNVQKFDINGTYLDTWGSMGSEPGKFRWPRGVSVDGLGNVYVADTDMERMQKFDSSGNYLGTIQGPHNWEDGPFHPRAVEVNPENGEIYAAASYAHRIDRFNLEGTYNLSWGHHEKDGEVFNGPRGITVDPNTGDVLVADTHNHLIKRFSSTGTFQEKFGGPPAVDRSKNYLGFPAPIAVDSEGKIWGLNQGIYYPDDPNWGNDEYVRQFDSEGNYIFGFYHPDFSAGMYGLSIQLDTGEIYVSNTPKNKIMKFDPSGNLLLEFGSFGDGTGQFNTPSGIALDLQNEFLFVVDSGNQRIQKFDLDGNYLSSWGNSGSDPGEFAFNQFSGITVDLLGNIYVADSLNGRIQVFDSEGNFLGEVGSYGWEAEKFAWPASLAISGDTLFVLDTGGNEVEMYRTRAVPIPSSALLLLTGLISVFALRYNRR